MLFNSVIFFLFLPLTFGLVYSVPERARPPLLLAASYLFYMSWKASYIWIVIALTAIDYVAGLCIEKNSGLRRKLVWLVSLTANLGLLFVFKYLGFFSQELNNIMGWLHAGGRVPVTELLLPLGISFHTFQAISYTTDVYRGDFPAERNPLRFALFIAWFPQMVAGPIERAGTLLVQLNKISYPSSRQLREGLVWIAWGLFKKVVVADNIASFVDVAYDLPSHHSQGLAWIAFYGYALQIFCDFSGYTDIAKGCSLLFGVRLTENFDQPYLSRSFVEFWKRWHMTLSNWFFEYVFYPLARRNPSTLGISLAVLVTFLLSGLWHGANWTFLLWGLANAVIYLLYVVTSKPLHGFSGPVADFLKIAINFNLVCICWVIFRAHSITDVASFFSTLLAGSNVSASFDLKQIYAWRIRMLSAGVGCTVLALAGVFDLNRKFSSGWPKALVFGFLAAVLICTFGHFNSESFIYFQF